jgi:HTH-type transcriptional regulator, sugar sensing transcriptional regulator
MDKLLTDTLSVLGLSSKEIKFFEACYFLGPTTINDAAKRARLQRSTAYLLAQELIHKGFIIEDFKDYRKTITTVSPKTILRLLAAKQRSVRRIEIEFEEQLPALDAQYKVSEVRPYVRVYQGVKALTAIWEDVLATKGEILLWTNQETESLIFKKVFHDKFIAERIRKQIPIRALAVNNKPGKALLEKDDVSLRHSKLLPIHASFSAETYIYDDAVAMLDYRKDILGIIVESSPIAATQRAIFEMTWQSLS